MTALLIHVSTSTSTNDLCPQYSYILALALNSQSLECLNPFLSLVAKIFFERAVCVDCGSTDLQDRNDLILSSNQFSTIVSLVLYFLHQVQRIGGTLLQKSPHNALFHFLSGLAVVNTFLPTDPPSFQNISQALGEIEERAKQTLLYLLLDEMNIHTSQHKSHKDKYLKSKQTEPLLDPPAASTPPSHPQQTQPKALLRSRSLPEADPSASPQPLSASKMGKMNKPPMIVGFTDTAGISPSFAPFLLTPVVFSRRMELYLVLLANMFVQSNVSQNVNYWFHIVFHILHFVFPPSASPQLPTSSWTPIRLKDALLPAPTELPNPIKAAPFPLRSSVTQLGTPKQLHPVSKQQHIFISGLSAKAACVVLRLFEVDAIREYMSLAVLKNTLWSIVEKSDVWKGVEDAEEAEKTKQADKQLKARQKQMNYASRETERVGITEKKTKDNLLTSKQMLCLVFPRLYTCSRHNHTLTEIGITPEAIATASKQTSDRNLPFVDLKPAILRRRVFVEGLLCIFRNAETSKEESGKALTAVCQFVFTQILEQNRYQMASIVTLNALRVFLHSSNDNRILLTNTIPGCLFTICKFCSAEKLVLRRAGTKTLCVFFVGEDDFRDPDVNGSVWVQDMMKVSGGVVQHALLVSLLALAESHPPEKFTTLWSGIFEKLITNEHIQKYSDADMTLASSLVSLFARTAPSFELIQKQLVHVIPMMAIPNKALQTAVMEILIGMARRGEAERNSLAKLSALEWVSAGLRSEPDEIVFGACQFFAVYLSSIHAGVFTSAAALSKTSSSERVVHSGITFASITDAMASKMFTYTFVEMFALLNSNRSRRVVALASLCISCFAELGLGASTLLAAHSTSRFFKSEESYPYVRALLGVFQNDGNPSLSKTESEDFLKTTKLDSACLVARAIGLFAHHDRRVAFVVVSLSRDVLKTESLSATLRRLLVRTTRADLVMVVEAIGRLCRTHTEFRDECLKAGFLAEMLQTLKQSRTKGKDQMDEPITVHPEALIAQFSRKGTFWEEWEDEEMEKLLRTDQENDNSDDESDEEEAEMNKAMLNMTIRQATLSHIPSLSRLPANSHVQSVSRLGLNQTTTTLEDTSNKPIPASKWIERCVVEAIDALLSPGNVGEFIKRNRNSTQTVVECLEGKYSWIVEMMEKETLTQNQEAYRSLLVHLYTLTLHVPLPLVCIKSSTSASPNHSTVFLADNNRSIFSELRLLQPLQTSTAPSDDLLSVLVSCCYRLLPLSSEHYNTLQSLPSYWTSLGPNPPPEVRVQATAHIVSLFDRDMCLYELYETLLQQDLSSTLLALAAAEVPNIVTICSNLFTSPYISQHLRCALAKMMELLTRTSERHRTAIAEVAMTQIALICDYEQTLQPATPHHNALHPPMMDNSPIAAEMYRTIHSDDNLPRASRLDELRSKLDRSAARGAKSSLGNINQMILVLNKAFHPLKAMTAYTIDSSSRLVLLCNLIANNLSAGKGDYVRTECSYGEIAFHSLSDRQALVIKVEAGLGFIKSIKAAKKNDQFRSSLALIGLHTMKNLTWRGFSYNQARQHGLIPILVSLINIPFGSLLPNCSPDSSQPSFSYSAEKCWLAASILTALCRVNLENTLDVVNSPSFFTSALSILAIPAVPFSSSTEFCCPPPALRAMLLLCIYTVCTIYPPSITAMLKAVPSALLIISSCLFNQHQHETSLSMLPPSHVLRSVPFTSTSLSTVERTGKGGRNAQVQEMISPLARLLAVRLVSLIYLVTSTTTINPPASLPSSLIGSSHLSFFSLPRTILQAEVCCSMHPSSLIDSEHIKLLEESCRTLILLASTHLSSPLSSTKPTTFPISSYSWPVAPPNTGNWVSEPQLAALLNSAPNPPAIIPQNSISQIPPFIPQCEYPQSYTAQFSPQQRKKFGSYKEYDEWLSRRIANYRLFLNALDKWLVRARLLKQSGNFDVLAWNVLHRLSFDATSCEAARVLVDIAHVTTGHTEGANDSKSRDGIELICNILSTAGAPLEVLLMASELVVQLTEGKGEAPFHQVTWMDQTFNSRSALIRKKVEVYGMIKITNLLTSPISELRLNATRILLALPATSLARAIVETPKISANLASLATADCSLIANNAFNLIAATALCNSALQTIFSDLGIIEKASELLQPLGDPFSARATPDVERSLRMILPAASLCIGNLVDGSCVTARRFVENGGVGLFVRLIGDAELFDAPTLFCVLGVLCVTAEALTDGMTDLASEEEDTRVLKDVLLHIVMTVEAAQTSEGAGKMNEEHSAILSQSSLFNRLTAQFERDMLPGPGDAEWPNPNTTIHHPSFHSTIVAVCGDGQDEKKDESGRVWIGNCWEEERGAVLPSCNDDDGNEVKRRGGWLPLVPRRAAKSSAYPVAAALLDVVAILLSQLAAAAQFTSPKHAHTDSVFPPSQPVLNENMPRIRVISFEDPFK
ncbi:hypothetical protein BLNAU_7988 [Blattamonas nauphoetae]|uniref:Uncharacterized protein n=1 Tax=Blattamonas nauphoetae TaxID=2049346 RepID=A0ABQ9Y0B8_9EUKA|nr:hypothetical protein BLNAU_7988 [Blattamonas nauphoetae]